MSLGDSLSSLADVLAPSLVLTNATMPSASGSALAARSSASPLDGGACASPARTPSGSSSAGAPGTKRAAGRKVSQGKMLHTRCRTNETLWENATENALEISIKKNPLGK